MHIKIAELNTHSDGNGITGIPSAVFFNEMGNKKKKIWGKKRRTSLRNSSQLHTFSFFKICKFLEISNDCNSIKVAQLKYFGWKTTEILQYLYRIRPN